MRWFANFWLLLVVCLCGCQWTKKISNDSPSVIRGTSQGIPNKLAIPGQIPATRLAALEEPSAFIPPPPELDIDEPPRPSLASRPDPFKPSEPMPTKNITEPPTSVAINTNPQGTQSHAQSNNQLHAQPNTQPSLQPHAQPVAHVESENPHSAFKRLVRQSQESLKKIDGFECLLKRREVINDSKQPEELIQFRFRKAPLAVHFKWIGQEANGRELVYAKGLFSDRAHILTAKGDGFVLMPAKKRFDFALDDSNIKSKSRYDLREGGIMKSIDQLGRVLQEIERDPKGNRERVRYLGKVKRPECSALLEGVDEYIPPKWEPLLPKGGRRQTFFDCQPDSPSFGLPVVIVAQDHLGREVEYYHFDRLKLTRFTDADFDPDRLFKK